MAGGGSKAPARFTRAANLPKATPPACLWPRTSLATPQSRSRAPSLLMRRLHMRRPRQSSCAHSARRLQAPPPKNPPTGRALPSPRRPQAAHSPQRAAPRARAPAEREAALGPAGRVAFLSRFFPRSPPREPKPTGSHLPGVSREACPRTAGLSAVTFLARPAFLVRQPPRPDTAGRPESAGPAAGRRSPPLRRTNRRPSRPREGERTPADGPGGRRRARPAEGAPEAGPASLGGGRAPSRRVAESPRSQGQDGPAPRVPVPPTATSAGPPSL